MLMKCVSPVFGDFGTQAFGVGDIVDIEMTQIGEGGVKYGYAVSCEFDRGGDWVQLSCFEPADMNEVAPIDGVGLHRELTAEERDGQLALLRERNAELLNQVAKLERLVKTQRIVIDSLNEQLDNAKQDLWDRYQRADEEQGFGGVVLSHPVTP